VPCSRFKFKRRFEGICHFYLQDRTLRRQLFEGKYMTLNEPFVWTLRNVFSYGYVSFKSVNMQEHGLVPNFSPGSECKMKWRFTPQWQIFDNAQSYYRALWFLIDNAETVVRSTVRISKYSTRLRPTLWPPNFTQIFTWFRFSWQNYNFTLHKITAYNLTLHKITAYNLTLHKITAYNLTLHKITDYNLTLHKITDYNLIPHKITDYNLTLHKITYYNFAGAISFNIKKKLLILTTVCLYIL
jgi:hypothetical protein